jgi:hypothetical protein
VAEERLNLNRAARQFLANVIVTDVETEKQIPGLICELSLSCCYVETASPFSTGVNVRLVITHHGEKVRVFGKVTHATENKGMGIAFTSTLPDDQTILEKWIENLRLSPASG